MTPFIRSPYNYDMQEASLESALECKEPTMTQQQFKDDADINVLIERFKLGYTMPTNHRTPQQGDFTDINSFEEAMTQIRQAQESFNALSAKVRYRFNNDPARYVEFFNNPDNQEEAIKLGLATKRPEAQTTTSASPTSGPSGGGQEGPKGTNKTA